MKPLTPKEHEFLDLFRGLDGRDQQAVIELMRDWLVQTKRIPTPPPRPGNGAR